MKRLEQNGLSLPKMILGTSNFGTGIDRRQAFELMDSYFLSGGDALDTARIYGEWKGAGQEYSETVVGAWLEERGLRDKIFVITKGAHPPLGDRHHSRVKPQFILEDMDICLDTLRLSSVGMYFLHRDDPSADVGPIMEALGELVAKKKTRFIGASNWTAARVREANAYAASHGLPGFAASEIQWSLAEMDPLTYGDDTLVCMDDGEYAAYRAMGVPILAYSSQAAGIFSSGYSPDLQNVAAKHTAWVTGENKLRYSRLLSLCNEKVIPPAAAALCYITSNPLPACAIIGPSSVVHLRQSLEADRFDLTAAETEWLHG